MEPLDLPPFRRLSLRRRGFAISALIFTPLCLSGCFVDPQKPAPSSHETPENPSRMKLGAGVAYSAIPIGTNEGVDVLDIDLSTGARAALGVRRVRRLDGDIVGDSLLPSEWLGRSSGSAVGAVNGGYFGREHADAKEIIGLLVQEGRVRRAAPPLMGHGSAVIAAGQYVRSAFGLFPDGTPSIVWAATDPANPQKLLRYDTPTPRSVRDGVAWRVDSAVGCGPMLVHQGAVVVTDRKERLASDGALPRTFLAYDDVAGRPKHLLVGIASAMAFTDLAQFLKDYFPKTHGTRAQAAMCLDGGSSTQMSVRDASGVQSPRDTGVSVPTSIVVTRAKHG